MATAAIPKLLESNLAAAINAQSWAGSGVAPAYDSLGAQLISWPSIRVMLTKADEEPENSGNFKATVDITVLGGLDPDNDSTFDAVATAHSDLCGNVHAYLTGTLANSDLEGAVSGYTNSLDAYDIRLTGFDRRIDTADGVFEDVFAMEIYLREA